MATRNGSITDQAAQALGDAVKSVTDAAGAVIETTGSLEASFPETAKLLNGPSGIAGTAEWKAVAAAASQQKAKHLRDQLEDAERCASLRVEAEGVLMDFARQKVDQETMAKLVALARKANVEGKRDAMFRGDVINETEKRSVFHAALRAPKGAAPMIANGEDQVKFVNGVLDKIEDFCGRVRSGKWVGATGKKLTTVLAIGIGGSYLGPEFLYEALRADATCKEAAEGRTLKFIANVDPVDFARQVDGVDASSTLVVVVSKSFTTAETIMNAKTVKNWLTSSIKANATDVVRQHVAAVSTQMQLTKDFGIAPENVFAFGDYVGGRFSVHSPVGVLPLALQYGMAPLREFLSGAHAMDLHFKSTPLERNLPVLLGLIGLYNSTFLGYNCKAILPYAQALLRFAAHVQQLDMESNGKRVAMDGSTLSFEAGEICFGEPGTNGQHSFYQLMHQGRVVPAEFIGFKKSQAPVTLQGNALSNHDELMCNFFAQPDALAVGKISEDPHKAFPGDRPSLSLLFDAVTPRSMGSLLALYEHRVAVQGWVWGINSFDQWGVQLGKVLAKEVGKGLVAKSTQGFNASTAALIAAYMEQ